MHKVAIDELPTLKDWLEKFLPETHKLYATVDETLRGRWRGTSFFTLGWPDILAAGEGPVDVADSACASYHMDPRTTNVFSPRPDHLETFLCSPGFYDWTKPVIFQVCARSLSDTLRKVSLSKGGNPHLSYTKGVRLVARPGELPLLPVPEGFEARSLDPDLHYDVVSASWPYKRKNADLYIRELLRCFPSIGLFDKTNGRCIGLEIGTDYSTMGLLYVAEEFRRRGFGTLITSLLAHKYFREGLPAVVIIHASNEISLQMHKKIGFKEEGLLDWTKHYVGETEKHLDFLMPGRKSAH